MADWSSMPNDILKLITKKLHSVEDYARFGPVCKSWYSIFAEREGSIGSTKCPWLMLAEKEHTVVREFYSPYSDEIFQIPLPEAKGRCCWGSQCGWVVTINPYLHMTILNPLTRIQMTLPSLRAHPQLNNLIKRCTEGTRLQDIFVYKAVMSSSPAAPECAVMIIYSDFGRLACTKPGQNTWTLVESDSGPVDDIIYFKGSFLAVNLSWEVLICDISGSQMRTVRFAAAPVVLDIDEIEYEAKYLMEADGELYMVTRNLYDTARRDIPYLRTWTFSAMKLNVGNMKWEDVEDLEDFCFFVGNNHSFSTRATEHPEFKRNAIYFTDDYCGFLNIARSFDMGIYNYDSTQIQHYPVGHGALSKFYSPAWFKPSFS